MNKESLVNNFIASLKETSYDKDNKDYMSTSEINVINFDEVKNEYISKKYWPTINKPLENIKSCDTFYIRDDDKFYLIEFKNGVINRSKEYEIHRKVYDSFVILLDIFNMTVADWREKTEFILVYNNSKNKKKVAEEDNKVQESKSRTELGKSFASKAHQEFIRFGLEKYQDYLFKKVTTLTKDEFENDYVNLWEKSQSD